MVTIIALISTPVVIVPASATSPALCVGAYTNLEIKIARHVPEHIPPDIIEEVEVVVPAIVPVPAVAMVIVPGHVESTHARCQQDQTSCERRLDKFHSSDLDDVTV
jgi:hypothetical protein